MDDEIEAPDASIPWRWVLNLALGFAVVVAVVVVVSLALRSSSTTTSRSPLAELADKAGCAQLRSSESSSPPRESGHCLLGGVTVDLETFPDDRGRDAWVTSQQVLAAFTGGTVCAAQGPQWAATARDSNICQQLATSLGGISLAS
jgi:hypothetical protein